MKTIIAGSRSITDLTVVEWAIAESGFNITKVVSGGAKGVDTLGEQWAKNAGIPVIQFLPDWKDFSHPLTVIKENKYGKYNAAAGYIRNQKMADYADALIAVWDTKSKGTYDMINRAIKAKLQRYIYEFVI